MFKQPNKTMAKYELKKQQEKDYRAIEDIKLHKGPTMVDNQQPWQHKKKNSTSKSYNNNESIDQQNMKMISKIYAIQQKGGQTSTNTRPSVQNESESISLHKNLKKKILEDITIENYQMTKRIYQTKSTVDFKKFDLQRQQTEKYLSLLSESFASKQKQKQSEYEKTQVRSGVDSSHS